MKLESVINKIGWSASAIFLISLSHFNSNFAIAQETKEEKCEKLYVCYQEFNKECSNDDFQRRFAPRIFHKFGVVNLEEEWAILDMFSQEMGNNPEDIAYVIYYGGKVNKYGEAKERVKRITYYLTENRGKDPKKIIVVNGGFREKFEFELWLSPVKNSFPPLTPAIDPEKVIFKGKMKPLPIDLGN